MVHDNDSDGITDLDETPSIFIDTVDGTTHELAEVFPNSFLVHKCRAGDQPNQWHRPRRGMISTDVVPMCVS